MAKSKSGKEALDELIRSVSAKEDLLMPLSEKERNKKKSDPEPVEEKSTTRVEDPPPAKIEHLADLMRHLSLTLEKSKMAEYMEFQKNPWRLARKSIWQGFFAGLGIIAALLLLSWGLHQVSGFSVNFPKPDLPQLHFKLPGFLKKLPSFHQ